MIIPEQIEKIFKVMTFHIATIFQSNSNKMKVWLMEDYDWTEEEYNKYLKQYKDSLPEMPDSALLENQQDLSVVFHESTSNINTVDATPKLFYRIFEINDGELILLNITDNWFQNPLDAVKYITDNFTDVQPTTEETQILALKADFERQFKNIGGKHLSIIPVFSVVHKQDPDEPSSKLSSES
jgi:Tfp pilus assembly protein PilE